MTLQETKQTAVDYCYEAIITHFDLNDLEMETLNTIMEIAKGKEMRQIKDAFDEGEYNIMNSKRDEGFKYEVAEQYYNDKYVNNEQ